MGQHLTINIHTKISHTDPNLWYKNFTEIVEEWTNILTYSTDKIQMSQGPSCKYWHMPTPCLFGRVKDKRITNGLYLKIQIGP